MTKTFTYTQDYKNGFKAAYILGATGAMAQIHRWREEELKDDRRDSDREAQETKGTSSEETKEGDSKV
jgi:hypothetical protein